MTSDTNTGHAGADRDALPDALRWSLRGLRRDAQPGHDLWPAIAQRIAAAPQLAVAPPSPAWRRFAPLAMAASLALAVGVAWQLRPSNAPGNQPGAQLISAEADAMTREYQAALQEFAGTATAATDSTVLHELDRSAAQIRTAMARDPGARFLLDRLQDTYARRLSLTQRLALG